MTPKKHFYSLICCLIILLLIIPLMGCEKNKSSSKNVREDDTPQDFASAIKQIRLKQKWSKHKKSLIGDYPSGPIDDAAPYLQLKMNPEILLKSFDLGSNYLVNWQKPEGNFRYMYDWLDKTWVKDDNQVRQAGSLWGVSLCHQYKPTAKTREALLKGINYFLDNTIPGPDGSLMVKYMNDSATQSGTVALVALSIIEYLNTQGEEISDDYRQKLQKNLGGYLAFLEYMQLPNGHISKFYHLQKQRRTTRYSPYFDGESLLALCKAARYLDYSHLVPTIEKAARAMAETYTVKAWKKDKDSKDTKGFYQWGSMSYAEYYQSQWKDYELFGDVTLALGWWMTHTHETLKKGRNHAYAVEGLISAYRIAKMRKDTAAMIDLFYTIDRSMYKLTTWQIGGPLAGENSFLVDNPTDDPIAIGGVMNARKKSGRPVSQDVAHQLRIDVTQHQMHAVTMSLEYVYPQQ